MQITRHNYEEYFILYLDNELASEERRQVELFVQENPDLKTELDLLLQSQLTPDTTLVFSNKEHLIRHTEVENTISTSNYEEWLLLYTDNELTNEQRNAVEQFVGRNPAMKVELDALQKTKLQAEAIIFPDKESLYRKEKVRVLAIYWRRVAVAAALLLAVSSTALFIIKKNDTPAEIADSKPQEKENIPVVDQLANGKQNAIESVSGNNKADLTGTYSTGEKVVAAEQKKPEQKIRIGQTLPVEIPHTDAVIATTKEEKKKTNDLPQPLYNPNMVKATDQNVIAQIDIPVKSSLTNSKELNTPSSVTTATLRPLDNIVTASSIETEDPLDDEPGKKNKLRGFFRKVTRTFEKTTNIKATNDDDRLLVGGLAIKL